MISEIKDVFDKINKDRYVVGFDLNNRFAQISYCRIDQSEPDTLSVVAGEEEFNIPCVILKKKSTSQGRMRKRLSRHRKDTLFPTF